MTERIVGFTDWDSLAPLSAPRREGLGGFTEDRFCIPQAVDAAGSLFVNESGAAGEVNQSGMSGVIPIFGFTEWDHLAALNATDRKYPRQDLRLTGRLGGVGEYEDMAFCRPMPYEDPPAGLGSLAACCQSCENGGSCEGGLGGLSDFLPQWMADPQGIEQWALVAGLGVLSVMVLTPLVFPATSKQKGRRQALRKARLKAKARKAQIAVEYA